MIKILIISPHADDAEIGCGGYIARTVDEGGEVCIALMTVSSINFRHSGLVTKEQRIAEFKSSCDYLGVQKFEVLSTDLDGKMYTSPQSVFVRQLDDLQDEFKPDIVLIPLPSFHQDHRYCWEVGIATTRPSLSKHMPKIIAAYEYPANGWGDGAALNAGYGGMYVDIEDYWSDKVEALNQYKSQMRGPDHLISVNGCEALAKLRGLEAGFKMAELFHILRIRI